MPLCKNQRIELCIDSLSSDGAGVGRYEGQVVFVPGTAPGDRLVAHITKAVKSHAFARVEQLLQPGPGRIQPECPVSDACGGCCFRHIRYETELVAKRGFVADALQRIGGFTIEVPPVLPSPQVNRYRNKVQLPVQAGEQGFVYGFYAGRSHRVIACQDCLLQPEVMNRVAARTAALLQEAGATAYDEATHTGLVRYIYLRRAHSTEEILVCVVATKPRLPKEHWIAGQLATEFTEVTTVCVNHHPGRTNVVCGPNTRTLLGPGCIEDRVCGVPLCMDVHSFAQVNTPAAEGLFKTAARFAAPGPGDTLLDLYCGAGVIGLSMAAQAAQLIGVEIVPQAVKNARHSAAAMGLLNTRFLCEDAGTAAARLAAEGLRPNVVCVDPPRKGCDAETLAAILAMAPQRIVMVSCNPATMARDLRLLANGGYTLREVQPADLFPRTRHVECVALLVKEPTDEITV